MSDSESSTDYSSGHLSNSNSASDSDDDGSENFVFEGNFLPYKVSHLLLVLVLAKTTKVKTAKTRMVFPEWFWSNDMKKNYR